MSTRPRVDEPILARFWVAVPATLMKGRAGPFLQEPKMRRVFAPNPSCSILASSLRSNAVLDSEDLKSGSMNCDLDRSPKSSASTLPRAYHRRVDAAVRALSLQLFERFEHFLVCCADFVSAVARQGVPEIVRAADLVTENTRRIATLDALDDTGPKPRKIGTAELAIG